MVAESPAGRYSVRALRSALAAALLSLASIPSASARAAVAEATDEELMQAGMAAFHQGRAADAVAAFRKVLKRAPEHYGANFQMASVLESLGRSDEAIAYWDRAHDTAEAVRDFGTLELIRRRFPLFYPAVEVKTSTGTFKVRLDRRRSPITTANFLAYVEEAYYDGALFHRVYRGMFAQGGGVFKSGKPKEVTRPPIRLESNNGVKNRRGSVSMARSGAPDSATVQFYVNISDNGWMDFTSAASPGYAVFGDVVEGLEVVDRIGSLPASGDGSPITPVVIESIRRLP